MLWSLREAGDRPTAGQLRVWATGGFAAVAEGDDLGLQPVAFIVFCGLLNRQLSETRWLAQSACAPLHNTPT